MSKFYSNFPLYTSFYPAIYGTYKRSPLYEMELDPRFKNNYIYLLRSKEAQEMSKPYLFKKLLDCITLKQPTTNIQSMINNKFISDIKSMIDKHKKYDSFDNLIRYINFYYYNKKICF